MSHIILNLNKLGCIELMDVNSLDRKKKDISYDQARALLILCRQQDCLHLTVFITYCVFFPLRSIAIHMP